MQLISCDTGDSFSPILIYSNRKPWVLGESPRSSKCLTKSLAGGSPRPFTLPIPKAPKLRKADASFFLECGDSAPLLTRMPTRQKGWRTPQQLVFFPTFTVRFAVETCLEIGSSSHRS